MTAPTLSHLAELAGMTEKELQDCCLDISMSGVNTPKRFALALIKARRDEALKQKLALVDELAKIRSDKHREFLVKLLREVESRISTLTAAIEGGGE